MFHWIWVCILGSIWGCILLLAFVGGICLRLLIGTHDTYFEANNLANYFFNNDRDQVNAREVFKGDWQQLCVSLYPINPHKITYGRIVDEGMLDYLSILYLIDSESNIGILNFDNRHYDIRRAEQVKKKKCFNIDKTTINKDTRIIEQNVIGYDTYHTTFTLSETEQ